MFVSRHRSYATNKMGQLYPLRVHPYCGLVPRGQPWRSWALPLAASSASTVTEAGEALGGAAPVLHHWHLEGQVPRALTLLQGPQPQAWQLASLHGLKVLRTFQVLQSVARDSPKPSKLG